jgi:hypothetical protein
MFENEIVRKKFKKKLSKQKRIEKKNEDITWEKNWRMKS